MPAVYGVNVSKRAEKSANSFMHAQSGICGLSMLSAICSLTFSLIILHQIKKAIEEQTTAEDIPKEFTGWEALGQRAWVSSLGQLFGACCVGSILIAVGRHFIQQGESGGMKFCCILEGCCGCMGVLETCALCGYLIFSIWAYHAMGTPATICEHMEGAGAGATEAAITAAKASCEKWITALRPAMLTTLFFVLCIAILTCKVTALCIAGSKYAKETAETFEDEEYGEADYDDDAY